MRPLVSLLAGAFLLVPLPSRSASPPHSAARAAVHQPAARARRAPRAALAERNLDRDTLAWVGERAITALDLVQRIEWMPWPGKNTAAGMDTVKSRALRSLAAEALLAQEDERGLAGRADPISRTREGVRRVLARDALYRELIAALPPPSEAEIVALARRMHPEARPNQLPAWRKAASDSLRELSGERRAGEFLVAHLAGKRVEVDSAAFMLLADSLRAYMAAGHAERAESGGIIVPSEAPDVLLARLSGALERPFARLPDGPLSLGDALEDMRYYLFAVRSMRPDRFPGELSSQFRLLVQGELMGREALRRHMDERPDARHDLRMWTDAWHAVAVLDTVATAAPVNDDEAFRTLARTDPDRARELCAVDVEEILCATQAEAEAMRAALAAGAPFDSLARRHSRRPDWAARGGRSGFFPVVDHPQLGTSALLSPVGALIGPVRLPEGESIARVLGKRLLADSLAAREALENARKIALAERRGDRAARHVASLANGSRLRFADSALARVDILPSNMVVRRTLGFGGGMTAAPTLAPLWQWTRYWNGAHNPLP